MLLNTGVDSLAGCWSRGIIEYLSRIMVIYSTRCRAKRLPQSTDAPHQREKVGVWAKENLMLGGSMKLEKGTKAFKAFESGRNAYAQGLSLKDNPYVLGRYQALSIWWIQGFNDLKR